MAHLTSLPPCAKLPNVAVNTCKNENNLDTFSSVSSLFLVAVPECIKGTLLEFGDIVELLFSSIPSKLIPLSTFPKQFLAVVVVILLFIVDVIKSFVPLFNSIFGGKARSKVVSSLFSAENGFCGSTESL